MFICDLKVAFLKLDARVPTGALTPANHERSPVNDTSPQEPFTTSRRDTNQLAFECFALSKLSKADGPLYRPLKPIVQTEFSGELPIRNSNARRRICASVIRAHRKVKSYLCVCLVVMQLLCSLKGTTDAVLF